MHSRRDDVTYKPPAWIGVGDIDLFFNEHVAYAERLIAAGVLLTLEVVPGSAPRFLAVGSVNRDGVCIPAPGA